MGAYRQSSLRVLAPASLVVFAIAFLVVVIASLTGGDSSSSRGGVERVQASRSQERQDARKPADRRPARRRPGGARFYTVRSGDSLSTIAAKTGVPVATLLQLNPSLDPQGLVNGQRVRLPGGALKNKGATGASGATGTTGPE